MRVRRNMSVLFLLTAVLIALALTRSAVRANDQISSTLHGTAVTSSSQQNRAHVLYAGLWRTDGSFTSTIRIKNILVVGQLQVTPTLFMADGTAYPLPPVNLSVSGVATVNINDALAAAPQSVAPHISQFGSATLLYSYSSPGHVIAAVSAIDVPRSLSFVYPIIEPMPMPGDTAQKVLEGLWWKHDSGVHGSITLSNTTDQQRIVMVREMHASGDQDSREVQIAPHTTKLLELEQISRAASDPRNNAGGIRVEYQGPRESILVTGSLANESEGYSANMPFSSHMAMPSSTPAATETQVMLASAGLMIGKPDPMMMPGFPADTRFTPYLVLRNTTNKPSDVSLQLNYMTGMEGSAPINRNLPRQRLHPFEAKQVNMRSILASAGLTDFNGTVNLRISFSGNGGDLVLASGSVDQTGTYVFAVDPQGIGNSLGKITGYWSTTHGDDTMFSAWNPTDAPQDIVATIYYGDGSGTYHLPIHLAPQASAMIDIAMLMMNKTPDAEGKIIPSSIQEGSASFASSEKDPNTYDGKKRIKVVISGGIFNVANATYSENCAYCDGYSNFTLSPASLLILVGGTASFSAHAVDSYGTPQTLQPDSWGSDNTSVMNNSFQAVGPGSTDMNAYFNNIDTYQGQFCVGPDQYPSCPTQPVDDYGSVTAQVPTSLRFITVTVLPNGSTGAFGCPPSKNYGIRVDIKYEVLDQQSTPQPIQSSSMTPHEQGKLFDGTAYDNNIGPVTGYPTSGATTASDGTFHDVPFGYCQNLPINTPATASQNITIILNGKSYAVRNQTWSVSASGSSNFGHGTIKNTITSPGTGSDVSATR